MVFGLHPCLLLLRASKVITLSNCFLNYYYGHSVKYQTSDESAGGRPTLCHDKHLRCAKKGHLCISSRIPHGNTFGIIIECDWSVKLYIPICEIIQGLVHA